MSVTSGETKNGAVWTFDRDSLTLSVKKALSKGNYECITNWNEEDFSEELLQKAIEGSLDLMDRSNDHMVPGQQDRFYRRGNWILSISTGPPTWWFPRILFRNKPDECYFVLGWLRLGFQAGKMRKPS